MSRLLACAAVLACGHATAHNFCVDSPAAIQGALTVAQANGESDNIYIKTGEYAIKTALGVPLSFQSTEAHDLTLYGSYSDVSTCPPSPSVPDLAGPGTVLGGEYALRPLQMSNANGAITIEGVRFVSGVSVGPGGGLNVGAGFVKLAYDQFLDNTANGAQGKGGGVYVAAVTSGVSFYNNLLNGNQSAQTGAAWLYAAGDSLVANNTVVGNHTSTLDGPGGLSLQGAAGKQFNIANNILWDNDGSDLGVFSPNARETNDIGVITPGSTSAGFNSDISLDPQFAPCAIPGPICLNFELSRNSPLVDTGSDIAMLQIHTDVVGKPRKIGPHMDIGAFENDVIFSDGFE